MKRKALITGITGQDGAYLAEFLLDKGYEVHGIKRRTSLFNTDRIDHLYQDPHESGTRLFLHYGDLTDSLSVLNVLKRVMPDEVYNLGAQSHVAVSFEEPEYTANVDGLGSLRILEAARILGLGDRARIYQASSSEMFGKVRETPQSETTPFHPRSPYAVVHIHAHTRGSEQTLRPSARLFAPSNNSAPPWSCPHRRSEASFSLHRKRLLSRSPVGRTRRANRVRRE